MLSSIDSERSLLEDQAVQVASDMKEGRRPGEFKLLMACTWVHDDGAPWKAVFAH